MTLIISDCGSKKGPPPNKAGKRNTAPSSHWCTPDSFKVIYKFQYCIIKLKDVLSSQPSSPEQSDVDPEELEEEEEEGEPEQKTAYQKLLSTLSQPTSNDQSEEESSDEEEEDEKELLDEGGVLYFQR